MDVGRKLFGGISRAFSSLVGKTYMNLSQILLVVVDIWVCCYLSSIGKIGSELAAAAAAAAAAAQLVTFSAHCNVIHLTVKMLRNHVAAFNVQENGTFSPMLDDEVLYNVDQNLSQSLSPQGGINTEVAEIWLFFAI